MFHQEQVNWLKVPYQPLLGDHMLVCDHKVVYEDFMFPCDECGIKRKFIR